MFLSKILITDYRNIGKAELYFSEKLNCISGRNGSGKTNLLDAVYCLSMTKSFFHFQDAFSVRYGRESAALAGFYTMDDGSVNKIGLSICSGQQEGKTLKRNDKVCKRLSDHIGLLPVVMVSPSDSNLINLSADERRRFMNALLSQTSKEYLDNIQKYNKILSQRNKLLKNEDISLELLQVLDTQLASFASHIFEARENLCQMLQRSVKSLYSQLSGGKEEVLIQYQSDLRKKSLEEILRANFERDRILGFTTGGVHRDDMIFEMSSADGGFHLLKRCASQGQQKCFQIALKLSQFEIMKEMSAGRAPILLLDDVFDKLDLERVKNLLQMVSGQEFGQIFITDSDKIRMGTLVERVGGKCQSFEVSEGRISELK